jgi:formylglycine-generating enzyme required for sulfatase activity
MTTCGRTLVAVIGIATCLAGGESRGQSAQTPNGHHETARSPVRHPELIALPTTTFLMGSPVEDERSPAHRQEEKPQHEVTVQSFSIGRYLVTAEEFCPFLNETGNHKYFHEKPDWIDWRTIKKSGDRYVPQEGAERCPAFPVTWTGADAYCKWLNKKLGKPYRLPTEAEWELTARGKDLREWPWGNEPPTIFRHKPEPSPDPEVDELAKKLGPLLDALAGPAPSSRIEEGVRYIYWDHPDYKPVPFYSAHGKRFYTGPKDNSRPWLCPPVGSFPLGATPEGVYEMVGYYAGQWCADVYDPKAYAPSGSQPDAQFRAGDAPRSLRGNWRVRIKERLWAKQDKLALRLLTLPLTTDAAFEGHTNGRTWSRDEGHPTKGQGMFRVARSHATE